MQNHHGSDQLANSWAGIFSDHLDANTLSNSSTNLVCNTIPPPSSLHNLLTNDQNQRLIHPLGGSIALDPASITEPAFPTLPPLITSSGHAKEAEVCNYTRHNDNRDLQDEVAFARACMQVVTASVDTNSMSRTGSYASLSDFKLGASKGVSFKQSGKQRGIRHKQMANLFHTLRSLLPPNILPQKQHDRCTIIEKTCDYITCLERQLQVLKRKAKIWTSIIKSSGELKPNAKDTRDANENTLAPISRLCIAIEDEKAYEFEAPHIQITHARSTIIINVGCYETKRGLFPILLNILERRHLEVLCANRSQHGQTVLYMIHAQQSSSPSKLELKALKEELYIQTAIMLL